MDFAASLLLTFVSPAGLDYGFEDADGYAHYLLFDNAP